MMTEITRSDDDVMVSCQYIDVNSDASVANPSGRVLVECCEHDIVQCDRRSVWPCDREQAGRDQRTH